ncbi:hypothetical protein HOY34_02180 [Xinfangfangia sp. D13-10-4-6]|uniref:hypothetical protein n=1 Tax=Pseudogemmobacter hezensis TaxID=2737662 RepID=UPI0015561CB7|nr:hypothetical protein [Pseudogemmobacter hezensis]NPD14004.1 hypothetical protein [Pseudogemmobacter hezensis]
MTNTNLTLPSRPLRMTPGAVARPIGAIFGTLVMLALSAFFLVWQGPDLWRDWQISQNPVLADRSDVSNGKCTARKGVLTDCEAHVSYDYQGQHYESDVKLLFVDMHAGDYEVDVVISADKPHLATLTLGLEKLNNRLIMIAIIVLGFFAGGIALLRPMLRAGTASRILAQEAPMTLVPVEIVNAHTTRGTTQISYKDKEISNRVLAANFAAGEEPLMVWGPNGEGHGLAVRSSIKPFAGLLDQKLTRISLTDQERRDALAQLEKDQPSSDQPSESGPAEKASWGILRKLRAALGIALLVVIGIGCFWIWYVTSADNRYNSLGMEINAALPEALNKWGCEQLEKRFGDQPAPHGCTAADFTSWK